MTIWAPSSHSADTVVDEALRRVASRLGSHWRAGDRLPPVRLLADELDVSPPTAYRAVRRLVHHGFLVVRARQGVYVSSCYSDAQLQSLFNTRPAAPPLSGKRVAVFLPPDSTHMWPAYEAVMHELAGSGCELVRGDYQKVVREGYVLDRPDLDALILLNPDLLLKVPPRPGQHLVVATSAAGLPQIATDHYDLVSVDQESGAKLAGRYLRSLGCRDVAFLGMVRDQAPSLTALEVTSFLRLHGFECGWGEPLASSRLLAAAGYSGLFGARAAKAFVALSPRPQGVFAASDDLAVGFINAMAGLGHELHRDYQLVSFDGQRRLEQIPGGVCSVSVPAAQMGYQAVQLLLSRIQNPSQPMRKVLLGCTLNPPHSGQQA